MRKSLQPRVLVLFIFLIFSKCCFSQSLMSGNGKIEAGLSLGPLFFLGDLGGNHGVGTKFVKDVNLPLTNMAKGIYAQFYVKEWLSFRLGANMGRLEGADSAIKTKGEAEQYRKDRNLSFRSDIKEAYLLAEFCPTYFLEKFDDLQGKIRPYLLIGVGVFHFNPQTNYKAPDGSTQWVDLQPLHLEGQGMAEYPDRKMYKLTQIEIPMGAGIKYYINEKMFVGIEVLHRKTFTDYIDDVSKDYVDPNLFQKYLTPAQTAVANQLFYRGNQTPTGAQSRVDIGEQRGNPKNNDSFFSTVLRLGIRFNDSESADSRAMRQLRCPTYY